MSMSFANALLEHTEYEPLTNKASRYGEEFRVEDYEMTDEMVTEIRDAADRAGDRKVVRTMEAIAHARGGSFDKSIPNFYAAPEVFKAYFKHHLKDGWVYKTAADGHLDAWLVSSISIEQSRNDQSPDRMVISMVANGPEGGRSRGSSLLHKSMSFEPGDLTRKKVSDVLLGEGAYVETDELRADYDAGMEHYASVMKGGFSNQFRFSGKGQKVEGYGSAEVVSGRKVIHDMHSSEIAAPAEFAPSVLFEKVGEGGAERKRKRTNSSTPLTDYDDEGVGPVPTHFRLRVFDLGSHDFLWANSRDLTRYVYDASLREKIILPADQRELLDILTADLDAFTGDVIEGKTAGNVVLCKGTPGVGKTLTAEVYGELIERPLYSIHSGTLGVDAKSVRENLEVVFKRAKRWNAVLLLDEADVFVLERGNNLQQNAIVAEFLRTLEYFDGLMFMTTNRGEGIDDAILSRAAAIIDYKVPDIDGIRGVWEVLAKNYGAEIPADVLDDIVNGFEVISPRDVKMLLRLALRVAKSKGIPLDTKTIAKCAMFRGLHYSEGSRRSQ